MARSVPIKLSNKDRVRYIRFGSEASMDALQELQLRMPPALIPSAAKLQVQTVAKMMQAPVCDQHAIHIYLFHGLKHEDRKLTQSKLSGHVDDFLENGGTYAELGALLIQALAEAKLINIKELEMDETPPPGDDDEVDREGATGNGRPTQTSETHNYQQQAG